MTKKASYITLGCKLNYAETSTYERGFMKEGYESVPWSEKADLYVINTCSVTEHADRKSRNIIRKIHRTAPDATVIVTGCYAQLKRAEVESLEGVSLVFGANEKNSLVKTTLEFIDGRNVIRGNADVNDAVTFAAYSSGEERTRSFLKVQDGCDNFCTYCIIPFARGRVLSLPEDRCAAEAASLAAQGYKEIVVTGIEIASWGKDLKNGKTLIDALEAVAAGARSARIHLGSLEPTVVTDSFVERLKKLNVCPHFHLSMQSGCDETLARMRRKYTTAEFFAVTERLRAAFPGCALTTDLITGFPGETEEEFSKTLAFIEKCAFAQMHVFPYSIRPGTKAAGMPGQIEKSEKAARAARAAHIAERMQREYLTSCVGKTLEVIFETESDGESRGHAENYTEVAVPGDTPHGVVRKVKITGVRGEMLVGTAL